MQLQSGVFLKRHSIYKLLWKHRDVLSLLWRNWLSWRIKYADRLQSWFVFYGWGYQRGMHKLCREW